MSAVLIFQFVAYSIVTWAGAVLFSVLNHRFRQRSLQKIPGPSNPSLWGHTEKWHASMVFSDRQGQDTYSLWYLIQRHATTLRQRLSAQAGTSTPLSQGFLLRQALSTASNESCRTPYSTSIICDI
ncbi:hypothetical protein EDB84DRAFT_1469737 [Lactarius hengduanensis]|nr:hypothetical protein EDB84DRAFT_1469737 [Lactarius hengduanensis]